MCICLSSGKEEVVFLGCASQIFFGAPSFLRFPCSYSLASLFLHPPPQPPPYRFHYLTFLARIMDVWRDLYCAQVDPPLGSAVWGSSVGVPDPVCMTVRSSFGVFLCFVFFCFSVVDVRFVCVNGLHT